MPVQHATVSSSESKLGVREMGTLAQTGAIICDLGPECHGF